MILLYDLTAFPLYCTCLGFLWGENLIDLRQTNTELGSSCYSSPAQDTHSTSFRTLTMYLYWIRPLVFLISRKKNFFWHIQAFCSDRDIHEGSAFQRQWKWAVTFFAIIVSPLLCSFLATMRKVKRVVARFSCFLPTIYASGQEREVCTIIRWEAVVTDKVNLCEKTSSNTSNS